MPRIMSNRYVVPDNSHPQGMTDVCEAFDAAQGFTCAVKIFKGGGQREEVIQARNPRAEGAE